MGALDSCGQGSGSAGQRDTGTLPSHELRGRVAMEEHSRPTKQGKWGWGWEALGLGTGSSCENKAGTEGGAHEKHCSQLR